MRAHLGVLPGLAVLLSALLLVACDSDDSGMDDPPPEPPPADVSEEVGPGGGTLTTDDGRLTLTIPSGALSNTETITIDGVSTDDLGSAFDEVVEDLGVENAYELGPDGLDFQEPVTVRLASDQAPVQTPDSVGVAAEFLFTSDAGTIEGLDSLRTTIDTTANEVVVTGQMTHFTPLVTTQANNGVSFFVFDVPETLDVDDEFEARAVIGSSTAGPLAELVTLESPARYTDESAAPLAPTFSPLTQELSTNDEDNFEGIFSYTCPETGRGVYEAGLSVQVTFDFDSGPVTAESFADFVTTVECVEAPEFALSVLKEGSGSGSVASDPGGIDCGEDCEDTYPEGTEVTLTATPNEGSVFDGWSGNIQGGTGCDGTGDCIVEMDADRTVTANFNIKAEAAASIQSFEFVGSTGLDATVDWTIQVNPDADPGDVGIELDLGDGTTSTPPSIGEQVGDDPPTFSGQTDHTYDVPGEYEPSATLFFDGESIGTAQTSVVTEAPPEITGSTGELTGLRTIAFDFQMRWNGSLDLIQATFDGDGDGEDVMEMPVEQGLEEGLIKSEIEFEYTDDLSFPVMSMFEVANTQSGESNSLSFEMQEVTLAVEKDGQGTVTGVAFPVGPVIDCGSNCEQEVLLGRGPFGSVSIELTASAADGYDFAGWSGDIGDAPSGSSTITVEMNQDRTVTATFEKESGPEADLFISVDPPEGEFAANEEIEHDLTIGNDGPSEAESVGFVLNVDLGEFSEGPNHPDVNCDPTPTQELGCSYPGTFPVGMWDLTVTTRAEAEGTQTVNGEISAFTEDPNESNNTDEGSVTIEGGVNAVPTGLLGLSDYGITSPEAPFYLAGAVQGWGYGTYGHASSAARQDEVDFGQLTGTFINAYAGSNGFSVVDLRTGEELLRRAPDLGIIGSPAFGVIGLSETPVGPESPATIIVFGETGIGFYDTEGGGSNIANQTTAFDAFPAGGNPLSGYAVAVQDGVHFIGFSEENQRHNSYEQFVEDSAFDNQVVSAWMPDDGTPDDTPALVLDRAQESGLYLLARGGSPPVRIADLGSDARKVRCINPDGGELVCGVTVFGDDEVTILTWDGQNAPTVQGTVPVGDGPVDLGLTLLANGNVALVTTGFNDHTVTEIEIAPDGSVVGTETRSVLDGCQNPGHALYVQDDESLKVVGTCFNSDNAFVEESRF